ncbi:phosphotransferase [Patescibacteria group bacterium]|nr:phosphotransferase [Patescibacteria group bacterium]
MFARWLQLSGTTLKYSLYLLLHSLHLRREKLPRLLRQYLEECGGAFVKVGQLLALRYEILPPEYCWELSELFDNVAPFNLSQVETIIYYELGRSPYEIFTLFEEQPIASASFAQVHKAVLADGKTVAVKIQRPGLESMVRSDFFFLRMLGWFSSPYLHLKAIRISELLEEMEETTLQELDFRREKENAELIRQSLPADSRCFIPYTYPELTTAHVLVQEFVEGVRLNDIMRSRRQGIPPQQFDTAQLYLDQVAYDLLNEITRQYFNDGIYHADPHPGNIIITPEGKIGIIDFGLVGRVSLFSRALFWEFVRHTAVDGDYKSATEAFLRLGFLSVEDRLRFLAQDNDAALTVLQEMVAILASSYYRPFKAVADHWAHAIGKPGESLYDRSTAVAFFKAMRLVEQYNVHFQKDIILFIRTLVIADMTAMQISPTFKMSTVLEKYAQRYRDEAQKLQETAAQEWYSENEQLLDPWNQDSRDKSKEYIIEWFNRLIEDRPELYQKIRPPVEQLRQILL